MLSGRTEAVAVTRANILAYSIFLTTVVVLAMSARGLFSAEVLGYASIMLPLFCAAAAIVGAPVW